ncbi:reverse transcriptase domain-containing protein [Tanacetum coccineum]
MMPPQGFSTPPQIPNNTTSERPPVTTTVFSATTPKNTPFVYRASTSANLIRERRRQIRNDDLRAELEYFSKDYDEEREMEPRHEPNREATPTLRPREGNRARRNAEGIRLSEIEAREDENRGVNLPPLLAANLGRNESGQPLRSSLSSVHGGHQPLTNTRGNLPPNGTLLSHHAQPFIPSSLHTSTGLVPIHVNPYSQPSAGLVNGQTLNFPFQTQIDNPPDGGTSTYHPQRGYIPRIFTNNGVPSYNGSMYPAVTPSGLFADFTGSITPFVRWIEDYPLPDGLNALPYCQQKKFTKTHLAVHNIKQREGESTRAFVTRYTDDTLQILGLHEVQRISGFVHGLRTRSLVEHLSTDLPSTYKGLMEKTYTWIEVREVATNETPNDRRENFERSRKSSWDNNRGQKGRDRNQIEEAVRSGQLSHLVKGIKKERVKAFKNQRTERKKDKSITPVEAPILMIRQDESYAKNTVKGLTSECKEITFPSRGSNSLTLVVIKAKIFGREVNRVHIDGGSSCKVIYEHCFMKLKPSIRASKVDSNVPLMGFSREKSWSIGKIPLEITIGDPPLTRKETLNFVIVKSDSPYNMLLGRTTMQKLGIMVSTIHGAIKFHTTEGIGIVFSTYESDKVKEGMKKIRETPLTSKKGVFSCTTTEEKVVVNNKYPEQAVTIEKQLSEHFKERLRDLLRAYADVFAWTHTDMTGIPRTITVKGKPFNTEHKLNEYSHVKPIKQKRRGLGPNRSTTACKEVKELTKA